MTLSPIILVLLSENLTFFVPLVPLDSLHSVAVVDIFLEPYACYMFTVYTFLMFYQCYIS